nr:MAG TPA: adenine-specific methyltransferase [Caudoviricetes sp.]
MEERYKPSPIFYMGNKYKLLKQLIPLFPTKCRKFIDAFGGSGVISMNYRGGYKTYYNEIDPIVIELVEMIKSSNLVELNAYYLKKIKEYDLRTKSDTKTPELNANGYYKLREEYNNSKDKSNEDLFLLLCYSMNHLLRFNKNGEFNASNGNGSYNEKNFNQLKDFKEAFKNIYVTNCNVFNLNIDSLSKEDFIYFDPPYTNTLANYMERGKGWNKENDIKLFELIETLNKKGIMWGLSNVFCNRGKENTHLIEWCNKNNWSVYHLNRNYNPFSKGNSNNDEVYIYNYKE